MHSTANFLPLAILKRFKTFFPKNNYFFLENRNFERFEKSYFQSHSAATLLSFAILKNSRFFFRKIDLFF